MPAKLMNYQARVRRATSPIRNPGRRVFAMASRNSSLDRAGHAGGAARDAGDFLTGCHYFDIPATA